MQRYDLELFESLNEEYRAKPIVPKPQRYSPEDLIARGRWRASQIAKTLAIPLTGSRIVEIGCGRGETCQYLADEYGCEVVGVDIERYPEWEQPHHEKVTFVQADLSDANAPDLGLFDGAYSNAVWEHVRHPFTMLKRVQSMLKPQAPFYLVANLYRGPQASHLYRDVFFPWPHLLFRDDIFEDFYRSRGLPPKRPAWINQLTIADYHRYFFLTGFGAKAISFDITPIDEPFYARFADVLERFPRYDLERDFIKAILFKKS